MTGLADKTEAPGLAPGAIRLNIGCGRDILPGWSNIDSADLPGVDVVADLERMGNGSSLPFAESSVSEFRLFHVIEHIRNVLPLMQELWRVAAPGALMKVRCPHAASDEADEDPTHVRRMVASSFGYFSQPYFWRADYGFRGDWQPEIVRLLLSRRDNEGKSVEELRARIKHERNVVVEMIAELRAVKPLRLPLRNLIVNPKIVIHLV